MQLSRWEVAGSGPQNGLGSGEKGGHSGPALEVGWPGRSSGLGVEDGQREPWGRSCWVVIDFTEGRAWKTQIGAKIRRCFGVLSLTCLFHIQVKVSRE